MATLISFPMARSLGQDVETPSPEWITRFVDDIPTGVAVFDRDLNYVAANTAWLDAFALGVCPLQGQRHDALDPVSGAQIGELQRRALCGQVVEGCNTVERDAAGRLHHRAISARVRAAALLAASASDPVPSVRPRRRRSDPGTAPAD